MTKLRRPFLPIAAMALAFALSSCASGDADQFDPTDWVPTNWFGGGKKPLPGERHEVFPGGVPGVPQGVPPDLVMGHQQTPDANGAITTDALAEQHPNAQGSQQGQAPQQQAAAEAPKQKPKHVASRPKRTHTTHTVKKRTPKGERSAESAPATSRAPQSAAQQQSVAPAAAPAAAPWPTQPSQPAAQNGAAWPTPSQ